MSHVKIDSQHATLLNKSAIIPSASTSTKAADSQRFERTQPSFFKQNNVSGGPKTRQTHTNLKVFQPGPNTNYFRNTQQKKNFVTTTSSLVANNDPAPSQAAKISSSAAPFHILTPTTAQKKQH